MDGEIKEESIDFEVKFRTNLMHFIAKNMGIIETSYLNFAPFTEREIYFLEDLEIWKDTGIKRIFFDL